MNTYVGVPAGLADLALELKGIADEMLRASQGFTTEAKLTEAMKKSPRAKALIMRWRRETRGYVVACNRARKEEAARLRVLDAFNAKHEAAKLAAATRAAMTADLQAVA